MSWLENLKTLPDTSLNDRLYFIDADTIKDDEGNSYRLQGFDAPEVAKLFESGEAGGQVATEAIARLARDRGYTNIKPIIGEDGNPMIGKFDRPIVDLTDDSGDSFVNRILSEGLFEPTKYASRMDLTRAAIGRSERQRDAELGVAQDEWDTARRMIEDGALQEGAKSLGFKQTALNEQQLANAKRSGLGHYFSHSNTQIDHLDRDINNRSLNPFSDSWEQGWISVMESSYGIMNMMGETTGSDWLADIGEEGVKRQRDLLASYGETTLDFRDIDSAGEAFDYLGNNLALSIPYMVGTAVGALGAPFTYGASMLLPVSLYTGQVWNEMEGENKNAGVAIGAGVMQAALDRLGLKGIVAAGKPKQVMRQATEELVRQGVPRRMAQARVLEATRREAAALVGNVRDIAKEQIAKKQVFKDLSTRVGLGGATEAGTEALQEAIGYTAAHLQEGFDFGDLNNRMISGAVAGGSLGGALSVPGAVYNTGAWADLAYRLDEADNSTASDAGMWADWERRQNGRIQSVEEITEELFNRPSTTGPSFNDRSDHHRLSNRERTTWDVFKENALNVSQLWQGATRNIFTPELKARSRSARILADMFGGGLQRTFSGSSFESAKQHILAKYKNTISRPDDVYRTLSGNARWLNRKKRGQISQDIYNRLNAAVVNGVFQPDRVTGPNADVIRQLGMELNKLAAVMHRDQSKYNPELGVVSNYLFKYKALNKTAIRKDRAGFQQALVDEFADDPNNRMTHVDAKKLVDEILDNPQVSDVDEGFSVTNGGIVPAAHRRRTLRLSEREAFKDYMDQDIFANVSTAAKSAARYVAHRKYIGKNGEVVNKLLDDMVSEGVSPEEVNKVASRMKDYLDAESGNYKRPTSAQGKALQRVQRSFMMLTTLAGLPLATVSSIVEAALVHKALTSDQIFGKNGSLKTMGEEFAKAMWQGAGSITDVATGAKERALTSGQERLQELGFYEWDVGAATVTGVTETNQLSQRAYELFFKATGLTGWTNFTRAARAAIAMDYMVDKARILFDADVGKAEDKPSSKEISSAAKSEISDIATLLDLLGVEVKEGDTKIPTGSQLRDAYYKLKTIFNDVAADKNKLSDHKNEIANLFSWVKNDLSTSNTERRRRAVKSAKKRGANEESNYISQLAEETIELIEELDSNISFRESKELEVIKRELKVIRFGADTVIKQDGPYKGLTNKEALDRATTRLSVVNPEARTREQQEADEALRNLGIDVDEFVRVAKLLDSGYVLNEADLNFWNDSTREATFTFINDAVALPQSANRPIIYQDPRFALFTQFQGFMATFTANHIPKLWGEYVKRGTPAMKYNAFAIMTTMIMLGFASQYLKDLIKYGQKSPYLDDAEIIQRGVMSSGLLGTGERVIEQFFPIYEQRSDGAGEWFFNTSVGESPALSTVKRLGRVGGSVIEGDIERAAYQGLKTTPFLGPFTELNKKLASNLSGWNYNGEQ